MQLDKIILQNFRCFERIEVEFTPKFNVIIGANGAGKSSLMEGLCMAVSAFLAGMGADYRKFQNNDSRYVFYFNRPEYQFPISYQAFGKIEKETISWGANRKGKDGFTLFNENKKIAQKLVTQVQKGEPIMLPLVVYFGANRLWDKKHKESEEVTIIENRSRLDSYKDAINPAANYEYFKKWFITKELASLQQGKVLPEVVVVKKAVKQCVADCEDIYFNIETNALVMKMKDGRIIRWNNLSDGQQNILAMVADIAQRCINLNPFMGENALETNGIVLIDEIDVHLHPSWQQSIAQNLKKAFPNVQFIVTTHSPLVLHSLELGDRIISLEDMQAYYFDNKFGRDIEDTLLQIMDTKTENREINNYLSMVYEGEGKSQEALYLREKIAAKVGEDYKELAKADALLFLQEKNEK